MALERVIEQNQNPWRVKVREALFPYTVPGAKRTMSTLGKYEGLMFILYLVNMVILALPGGYDEPDGEKTMTLKGFELFFTVVYFFEIALSGLAFGFLDLLHPVRLVDFLLVAANLAILIGFYLGNLSWRFSLLPVRCSLRILRPFFVTTEFPNVRLFVVSVARSIMQLTDVTLLFIFFLLWFGVAGVFQFGGVFQTRCVSDFYSFATLPESSAINFFGAPSTLSWNSSKFNSTLNTLSLDMSYSSIIPVHSVFGTIITSTNVSEKMLVEALYTFSSSFISYYPQGLYDYICASDYLLTGDLATNLATALTDPEYTPPQQKRYLRRSVRSAPKKRENLTFTGTGTVYPATFTQSASHSPTLENRNIWYSHMDVIPPDQLLGALNQIFNLGLISSCSVAQTCSKEPSQALHGFICPYSYTCLPDVQNPYNGTVSFDNIGRSMLTLFVANTFELWYEVLWWQRDASDDLALPFMVLEIVIGSFMIIGLMVVVLTVEYDKAKSQERDRIATEMEQRKAAEEALKKRREAKTKKKAEGHAVDEESDDEVVPTADDPFAIFAMPSKKKKSKTADETAQEEEEKDEKTRNRGSTFMSLVARAKIQKAKEEAEEAGAEEVEMEQKSAVVEVSEEEEKPVVSFAEEQPGDQPTTKSMYSMSMVALFRRKLRKKIEERKAREGTEEDAQPKAEKSESSDSEEELRIEAKKQQEEREAQLQKRKESGIEIDEDSDSDEQNEMKLKRRAARAILRRKLEKETKPWKHKFRRARFYTKWYITRSRWFDLFVVAAVLASTATTCVEHYGMSDDTRSILDTLNIVWTLFLVVELGVRMLADTAARFFRRFFNVFDAINVTVGILDLIVGDRAPFLRALRVFRVFKLVNMSPDLKKWIILIADACTASPMLIFILLLVMFIFSTFGMQLFGGVFCGMDIAGVSGYEDTQYYNTTTVPVNFSLVNGTLVPTAWENITELVTIPSMYSTECAGLPRSNFDSFGTAMLTSFIIATGDNWNYIMYNGMNSVNVAVAIPFVVYFYVSVYILMNLLVSILLSAADREHTATEEELLEQQRQDNEAEKKGLLQKAANSGGGEEDPFAVQTYTEEDVERMLQENSDEDKEEEEDEEEDDDDYDEGMDVIVSRSGKVKEKSRSAKVVEELSRMWDRSRKSLKKVVEHKAWQTAMVLNILVGTCSMGFEDPIAAPDSKSVQVTRDIDLVTTIIFLIELALYVHVFGLVRKPSAYLRRDGWNVVDFCLIIISFTTMLIVRAGVLDSTSRTMLFVFFLRSLRPLRVIRQARGMRKVMSAVLGSLPEMKWVFVVTLGIFATWGVFGVFFFAGALRSCWLDGTMLAEADEALCATLGGDFINSQLHFDNILFAMLTIFVCSTLENWSIIMFRAMDIVAVGQPFRRNANVWASLYFIVAAAFCGLIVMNLFVSVLISSYNERKRKAAFQRSILLTKEQEAWITTNKRLARLLPIRNQKGMAADQQVAVTKEGILVFHSQVSTLTPQTVLRKQEGEQITAKVHHHVGRLRVKLREITRSSTFSNLFLAIVLANFVVSAIVTYPQSDSLTNTINSISQAFTICFVLEAALKIGGDTFAVYVSSTWNRLDFLVAMVSLIALILASFYDAKPFSLIETLRITRLARLTKEYFSLDRMISKFGAAILAIGHVMGVILMVYFIYAVLGMRMFGRVWQQAFGGSNNGGASDGIDTNQNFASLQHAMILLMRMTTQGDWPVLMMTSSSAFSLSSPNFCDLNIGNCGLAVPAAEVYYVTFIFLATVVLTNLFTAVLLDAFGSSGLTRALRKKEAEIFFKNWKEYDPDDTMTINPYDILPFIRSIPKECVLGFNGRPKRKRIGLEVNLLTSLQLVDLTHRVTWVALVDALCRAAYPIPFKPRNSIVYLVYTDLLHLPLQQFAQIGRNMLEITGAAQSFGKTAFMNVQRLSRLVSGKKIKRRNRARKSRSASGKRNSKKKGGKFDEADVNNIHQDVMMFLSTMPPDCMFNPFLLPSIFLSALKTIALHARDEMMKHFLHMNKNLIEDLDENGNLISTEPENLKGSKLNASALGSPSRRIDELGSPASPSAFSPREGGIGFNSSVSEADGGVTNTSIVDGSSIANGDIDDDPVLHLADLFPATHPVMAMLQPSDLRDLFSKCAALIMINAVIKKRRSRLAQRVLETKIERDILAKLRRELGIVVPESVLRSSNYREHDDVRSPLSITTQDNSNANASNSNTAPGSPDVRRARSVTQIQMGGQALMSSGMGGGGAGMASEIALDSRFSIATKPEEKPRDRRPTVMVKDSEEGGGDDPASPTGAEAASPPTAASPTESGSSSRKSKAPYDEFEIPYKPSTLRLPPRATEIVPDHSALEPLKWILIDDSHQHLFSTTHQRPGGSAFSPHASADDGAGLPSLLAPYDVCGMFAEIVLGDPILSANLLEEVQLTRATMTTCLAQLSDWRVASDQLHEIIKPMLLQGLQPMVFSEDLSDSVELLAFRALGAATTSTQAIKKASGITHIVPSLPIKLKDLIDASTIPALGRTPQLYRDVLKRQVQAGKERQNDHITQLMMSYKKLAATAEQLEKKVVDVWPQEGRKKMEEGVIALVNQCSQDFKRIEIDGVNSVFAGAKLPKTMYQTVGNVTTQVTTAPVNPTALAYRWVSLYRTLEMVQYISTQWDNVKTVKMLANPRATLTAASLKAVQYYYSVTDLSELSARANSNAAKAQARSMSVPQAIDKLVVNSLFRSPSPSNLDSLSAVLQDVLVQEVRKIIDGTGQLVKKPSAANPSSPLKDEKRRRSSTIKATSSNLSIAKTLENLAAAAASEEVAVDPLANETDEKRCLRILRDEMKTRINYAPQEREDPYLTSVVNFCSTLSKSEKMKAESKLTQAPRTNSAFAAADGKSNELIQRIPELLTLEEFEQQLIQDLEAMTSEIVSSIKFFVATPRKFVTAGAGFMKSLVKWKSGEVSDFSAISVRTLIVASERDKLNLSVDSVQKQRKLLGIAETEVDVLGHISNSHRASLSSITAFTPAVDVPTDILQKLETKMQENPEEVLLLRSEEGVTVHALTKTVVSPFATQPDARSVQHMLDVIMTLHAWANVVSTRRNRDPLNIMNESQETFEVLGKMTNTIAVVAKDSLKALAIHGHSHAASVSTTVQRLYRTQPGLDAALEGYARASAKCAVALNDLQRTFARLLCAATELIVSHENEKQQQIFRPQRKLARIAQVNEAENHSSAPPPMIQDGDEVVDSNPRGSSTQSSGNGDPLDIIGDARKPSSGDNNNRESASVSSPLWKRDSVKEQSSSSLRRGGGRSHEQLIADAKARMEARKLGVTPSFRDISASPEPRASSSSRRVNPAANVTGSPRSSVASPLTRENVSGATASSPLLLTTTVQSQRADVTALEATAQQLASLCRNPKPKPNEVLTVLVALVEHKVSIKYFQLRANNSSPATEKKYDKLPRNELLFIPALLKLSLPFSVSDRASVPKNASDCFVHATLSITKKANRDEIRGAVAISNISQVRYPLSLTKDLDCGFDSASSSQPEWANVLPRVVAVDDIHHRTIHFFLMPQESAARQLFQIIDAIRDSVAL